MNIACVLSGGIYNRSHVERLEGMVAEHLSQPYRFTCLGGSPFPGWWAKISLFEPGRFEGRVLYLDLDVTITGDLDDLANYPAPFAIIKDWNGPGFNSSVMAWDAGTADHLYTQFDETVMDRLRGDQDWINERFCGAATFPKKWCLSYKKNKQSLGHMSDQCKILIFHGKPKPWDVES